ncbi:LysM peptidoglycan-binding domain-containing protein [Streptomyces sp. NPDC002990]
MGLFDFLKSDKSKEHQPAEQKERARERGGQQPEPGAAPRSAASDAASATRAAADRMAAAAPPKAEPASAAPRGTHPPTPTPTPSSAAHKAVPAKPEPPAARPPRAKAASAPAVPGAKHTPTPASAAHKAVPAAPKPAPTAKKRTYTVRPGDSLPTIARRELGDEERWRELYAMNKGIIGPDPDLVRPGMLLTLPV